MASRAETIIERVARRPRDGSSQPRHLIGLIGRGIGASKSPIMHEREGKRLGLSCTYALIDFDREDLPDSALGEVLIAAGAAGFAGLNVTHPFKQAAISHLDCLSPEAAAIGAVNTVVFGTAGSVGHNTDCWGFAESFRQEMAGCSLDRVILFGAGGAGAAVAVALLGLGARHLDICDSDLPRARDLADRLNDTRAAATAPVAASDLDLAAASGVVNATPIGMAKYPGTPFPPDELQSRQWVADIVYFPAETEFISHARKLGCRTMTGAGMAVFQAVKAFELFTGIAPDRQAMTRHFQAA